MEITIQGLTKTYRGGVRALDAVDLRIPEGMFGLPGANGAGKTTLMRMLAGIVRPTAGRVSINGHDLSTSTGRQYVKRNLGYLPQELGLYPDLTAEGFLDYIGILKGINNRPRRRAAVEELLGTVGLRQVARRRTDTFSGGMKRRLGIAQALLGDPRLLIVDEPTAGLDPEERIHFRTLLSHLAGERTVLLSTHIVEDIASSCPRLAVLSNGKIRYAGDTNGLVQTARGRVWIARTSHEPPPTATIVSALHLGDSVEYRLIADHAPTPSAEAAEPSLEGRLPCAHARRHRSVAPARLTSPAAASATMPTPQRKRGRRAPRRSRPGSRHKRASRRLAEGPGRPPDRASPMRAVLTGFAPAASG